MIIKYCILCDEASEAPEMHAKEKSTRLMETPLILQYIPLHLSFCFILLGCWSSWWLGCCCAVWERLVMVCMSSSYMGPEADSRADRLQERRPYVWIIYLDRVAMHARIGAKRLVLILSCTWPYKTPAMYYQTKKMQYTVWLLSLSHYSITLVMDSTLPSQHYYSCIFMCLLYIKLWTFIKKDN